SEHVRIDAWIPPRVAGNARRGRSGCSPFGRARRGPDRRRLRRGWSGRGRGGGAAGGGAGGPGGGAGGGAGGGGTAGAAGGVLVDAQGVVRPVFVKDG